MKYLVYKNNFDKGGAFCSSNSELSTYLSSFIQKFNHKYNKKIGFYSTEELDGEHLVLAKDIVKKELIELIENYHIDADPNGFGRAAMKVEILGVERVLNHFNSEIDQIIYSLNGLFDFLNRTIINNGSVQIYGLGDVDVLDSNLVWELNNILKEKGTCTIEKLRSEIEYLFQVDGLIDNNPTIFNERIKALNEKGYLEISNDSLVLTEKGKVVNVWTNSLEKSIIIDKEELKKRFANNGYSK